MTQATADTSKSTEDREPLFPPEERFWEHYSPHHEFPLSVSGSITLAAIAVGLLLLLSFSIGSDGASKPPEMNLVEIDGAFGDLDGLGLGKTAYAPGAKGPRDEFTGEPGEPAPKQVPKGPQLTLPEKLPQDTIKLGGEDFAVHDDSGLTLPSDLPRTVQDAVNSIQVATNPVAPPKQVGKGGGGLGDGPKSGGTGGPKGKKGSGMKGDGGGAGDSPHGKLLTRQAQRTSRWVIDFSGDPQTHLAKLRALKVTLVIPTATPHVFRVIDLAQASAAPKLTDRLMEYKDNVRWANTVKESVAGLAKVLGLRETPPCFIIFLPKALEERMVVLEAEYGGRQEAEIYKTIWDVPRLPSGGYKDEPEIRQQIPRGR